MSAIHTVFRVLIAGRDDTSPQDLSRFVKAGSIERKVGLHNKGKPVMHTCSFVVIPQVEHLELFTTSSDMVVRVERVTGVLADGSTAYEPFFAGIVRPLTRFSVQFPAPELKIQCIDARYQFKDRAMEPVKIKEEGEASDSEADKITLRDARYDASRVLFDPNDRAHSLIHILFQKSGLDKHNNKDIITGEPIRKPARYFQWRKKDTVLDTLSEACLPYRLVVFAEPDGRIVLKSLDVPEKPATGYKRIKSYNGSPKLEKKKHSNDGIMVSYQKLATKPNVDVGEKWYTQTTRKESHTVQYSRESETDDLRIVRFFNPEYQIKQVVDFWGRYSYPWGGGWSAWSNGLGKGTPGNHWGFRFQYDFKRFQSDSLTYDTIRFGTMSGKIEFGVRVRADVEYAHVDEAKNESVVRAFEPGAKDISDPFTVKAWVISSETEADNIAKALVAFMRYNAKLSFSSREELTVGEVYTIRIDALRDAAIEGRRHGFEQTVRIVERADAHEDPVKQYEAELLSEVEQSAVLLPERTTRVSFAETEEEKIRRIAGEIVREQVQQTGIHEMLARYYGQTLSLPKDTPHDDGTIKIDPPQNFRVSHFGKTVYLAWNPVFLAGSDIAIHYTIQVSDNYKQVPDDYFYTDSNAGIVVNEKTEAQVATDSAAWALTEASAQRWWALEYDEHPGNDLSATGTEDTSLEDVSRRFTFSETDTEQTTPAPKIYWYRIHVAGLRREGATTTTLCRSDFLVQHAMISPFSNADISAGIITAHKFKGNKLQSINWTNDGTVGASYDLNNGSAEYRAGATTVKLGNHSAGTDDGIVVSDSTEDDTKTITLGEKNESDNSFSIEIADDSSKMIVNQRQMRWKFKDKPSDEQYNDSLEERSVVVQRGRVNTSRYSFQYGRPLVMTATPDGRNVQARPAKLVTLNKQYQNADGATIARDLYKKMEEAIGGLVPSMKGMCSGVIMDTDYYDRNDADRICICSHWHTIFLNSIVNVFVFHMQYDSDRDDYWNPEGHFHREHPDRLDSLRDKAWNRALITLYC